MAFTGTLVLANLGSKVRKQTVTFTADGDFEWDCLGPLSSMSLEGDGVDGGGTLTMLACNHPSGTFAALPTTALSKTAAFIFSVAAQDLGYQRYQLHLTGSTSPTLVVTIIEKRNA